MAGLSYILQTLFRSLTGDVNHLGFFFMVKQSIV